jgi:hypothetical protein
MNPDRHAGSRIGDNTKYFVPLACFILWRETAMDADRNLAASSESGECGTLRSDGESGGGVIEKSEGGNGFRIILTRFNAERSLARSGTKIFGLETFANPFCFLKAVEAGSGEKDCVDLAFGKLAQAGVDVATKLDGLNIGAQRFQLCAAALTAGADNCALRQVGETAVFDRDEHIAGIDSRWSRGQREGLKQFGWQIFEGMDGEMHAAFGERLFNLLGEHSFGTDLGERDIGDFVAGGVDDFDFNFVPALAQKR